MYKDIALKAIPHYWYGNIRFDAPYDVSDMSCHISYVPYSFQLAHCALIQYQKVIELVHSFLTVVSD